MGHLGIQEHREGEKAAFPQLHLRDHEATSMARQTAEITQHSQGISGEYVPLCMPYTFKVQVQRVGQELMASNVSLHRHSIPHDESEKENHLLQRE